MLRRVHRLGPGGPLDRFVGADTRENGSELLRAIFGRKDHDLGKE